MRVSQLEGVSERLVQLASREVFGATPQQWFRLARQNAAYRDLLRGACSSVTAVCQRWGFEHMGRFARDYRALFGESPRETLLRACAESSAER
jgi:AraC-like DNA-binding protein